MTVNGYIDYDPITKRFSISGEHARVLCDRDSISYTIPFVYWVPTLSLAMDKLFEAFRTGEGVPYSTYGREVLFAQGEGNRPMFINDIARWISERQQRLNIMLHKLIRLAEIYNIAVVYTNQVQAQTDPFLGMVLIQ